MQVCSDHTGEGTIWPVDANLRPEGKAGPLVRTLASHRGYYERWAKHLGVPGAAQGPAGRRRPRARAAVRRDGRADGLDGRRAGRLRRGHPGDAPPGPRAHPRPARRSGSSSSAPGGLRDVEFAVQLLQLVHGRADERIRATDHAERAGRADPRRLRRPRGRRGAARRLRVPAHPRAPDPALPAAPHPRGARRTSRRCAGSAAAWASSRTRSRPSTRPGSTTGARCAGCTRSSSTGRCSPPSPGSRAPRPGSRPRPPATGWPRSASPTRTPRCGTSRR